MMAAVAQQVGAPGRGSGGVGSSPTDRPRCRKMDGKPVAQLVEHRNSSPDHSSASRGGPQDEDHRNSAVAGSSPAGLPTFGGTRRDRQSGRSIRMERRSIDGEPARSLVEDRTFPRPITRPSSSDGGPQDEDHRKSGSRGPCPAGLSTPAASARSRSNDGTEIGRRKGDRRNGTVAQPGRALKTAFAATCPGRPRADGGRLTTSDREVAGSNPASPTEEEKRSPKS